MEYVKFGYGKKIMIILPGASIKPVSLNAETIKEAYKIFAEDFTVYVIDQKKDIEEGYSVDDMVEYVYSGCKGLGLDDVYFYGIAQGGMVGQLLAIKYPGFIRKMCICSTVSRVSDNSIIHQLAVFARKKDIFSLVSSFTKNVMSDDYYNKFFDQMIMVYKNLSDDELRDFAIRVDAMRNFDVVDRLHEIKIPVLVLGSKADRIFSYEQMKLTADILGCESYFYEGYAHDVYDEAEDIKERILNFFNG